ncbi:MAG TPA: DUF3048 domain-containing protein [Candidatus Limnocylindria bacterium]|nr:DUF3048 domain-containing protein [Candidatus Limnocylindria bacterium]
MTAKLARNATVVALACAVIASACGGGATPVASSSPSPLAVASVAPSPTAPPTLTPTPTPTPAPKRWPLTGLPAAADAHLGRRPLNVRIPNDPNARPQYGLNKADLVFEMIVEGGVTRFAAIFHSKDADVVGPVRSYRWSDLHITQMLRGALVSSGSTIEERDGVTRSIRDGNMLSVDAERDARPYYRVAFRPAPNNEFTSTPADREAVGRAGGAAPVEVPALAFVPAGNTDPTAGGFAGAQPATTVTVPFQGMWASTFTWDAAANGYRRSQNGVRTTDGDGSGPILAKNVIVMTTDIWQTSVIEDSLGSHGLDYRMTGGGPVSVFRDGLRVDGTWKRDSVLDMFTFWDGAGKQLLLEPGQSWIHFIYPQWSVTSTP